MKLDAELRRISAGRYEIHDPAVGKVCEVQASDFASQAEQSAALHRIADVMRTLNNRGPKRERLLRSIGL